MRVLLTGANGFIGSHLAAQLVRGGIEVVGCARDPAAAATRQPRVEWIRADFNVDVEPCAWLSRLGGIDAVINCAGILQASPGQSMEAIHRDGPVALFRACEDAGVARVVQISALGAEREAGTAYALTKHAADSHLRGSRLDWIILKPSLVYTYGSYGGMSLLRGLAACPRVLPLPGGGAQRFQPLHMVDLAEVVVRCLDPETPARFEIAVVGPEVLSLGEIVAKLRAWLGLSPAPVLAVPMGSIRVAARIGDAARWVTGRGTLTSTAVRQLEHGSTAEVQPMRDRFAFEPRRLDEALSAEPSHVQDRWHARLYFLRPLLRLSIAFVWVAIGVVGLLPDNLRTGSAMLAELGLGYESARAAFVGACVVDVLLGTLLALGWRVRAMGLAQLGLILAYLLFLTAIQPSAWLDLHGTLVKLVPLAAATLVMMALADDR